MPYNESTAAIVRKALRRRRGLVEKRMFGGIGFLLDGHMCCAVWKDSLILRVGAEAYSTLLGEPGIGEFDVTGRQMRGWIMAGPEAYEDPAALAGLLETAVEFVRTLPPR
jgi:hypothetical protein